MLKLDIQMFAVPFRKVSNKKKNAVEVIMQLTYQE